jgi:hypothetical protein
MISLHVQTKWTYRHREIHALQEIFLFYKQPHIKIDIRIEIQGSNILRNNSSVHTVNENLSQVTDANLMVTNI